jgi:hypothetical protein
MYALILLLVALGLAVPAHAQVHVDIGIHLPAPPQLVLVPEVRAVQYVPDAPANLFFYSGQYWAFVNDGWYVSRGYNGPWIVVAPAVVPRPVLRVPVRYYRVPPGHWKKWEHRQPPHWREQWGPGWAEKREWKGHEHERDDDDHGRGHGRGHGRDR